MTWLCKHLIFFKIHSTQFEFSNEAKGTLSEISVSKVKHLTSRKKWLHHVAKRYKRRTLVLNQCCLTEKQRILKAERDVQAYRNSMRRLNQSTQIFLQSQFGCNLKNLVVTDLQLKIKYWLYHYTSKVVKHSTSNNVCITFSIFYSWYTKKKSSWSWY